MALRGAWYFPPANTHLYWKRMEAQYVKAKIDGSKR